MSLVLPPAYQPVPQSGQPPAKLSDAASKDFTRQMAEVINRILGGKLNVVVRFTLAAGATRTTVTDSRISSSNALLLDPLTANAAGALATTYALAADRSSGAVTFTHANAGTADRTFNLAIIG